MKFEVSFPGGMRVDTQFRGHTIHTDQPVAVGGTDTAPAPFDLFLASLATCAGFYAMRFCQQRNISTEGLGLTLEPIREPETKKLTVRMELTLPAEFPDKYHDAMLRSVDHCAVKRAVVLEPPEFQIAMLKAGAEVTA